jgi:hypothetical protein
MSPITLLARSIVWFAATFAKACGCPPLDVQLESKNVECGLCSKPIEVRA